MALSVLRQPEQVEAVVLGLMPMARLGAVAAAQPVTLVMVGMVDWGEILLAPLRGLVVAAVVVTELHMRILARGVAAVLEY
jgi:hypothetical protein